MGIIRKEDALHLVLPGREIDFYVRPDNSGTQHFVTCVTTIPAGQRLPDHTHESAEEVMYLIQGTGKAMIGGEEKPVCAGDFIAVPEGSPHSVANSGKSPLVMCCSFSPPIDISRYTENAARS